MDDRFHRLRERGRSSWMCASRFFGLAAGHNELVILANMEHLVLIKPIYASARSYFATSLAFFASMVVTPAFAQDPPSQLPESQMGPSVASEDTQPITEAKTAAPSDGQRPALC